MHGGRGLDLGLYTMWNYFVCVVPYFRSNTGPFMTGKQCLLKLEDKFVRTGKSKGTTF